MGLNDLGQGAGWARRSDSGEIRAFLWTIELTPEEELQVLIAQVLGLVDDGVLNQGNGNALTSKLENALMSLEDGNTNAACNQLGAFVNQVEALVNSGKLTEVQGQPLIDGANALIEQLCG
jgi:hypothetical protein